MRARFAVCLALSVLVYAACGGRLVQSGSEDGGATSNGASPGAGGSSSQGATSNIGAASPRGGRSATAGNAAVGGGPGVAGATSAGGAVAIAGAPSMGGACACPAIDCAMGYKAVPNVNGCCFHCEPLCGGVVCPGIACGSGSHAELLAGQCCPTCVQDDCQQQQRNYQVFRQQLVDKYSTLGCMTNADCTFYYEKTQCAVGCGIAVPSAALVNLDSNLRNYAQSNCSGNCPLLVPPCDPLPAPVCFQGHCQ